MINIWVMRMSVFYCFMMVMMSMWFFTIPGEIMYMLMMLIVNMAMVVGELFMHMFMFMMFGEM